MIYLTDNPESTVDFLPSHAHWDPLPEGASDDGALWDIYSEAPAWCASVAHDSERRVVLVDRAERSQFDDTLAALKKGVELPDGLVCLALEGARFRGQRERPWTALRGNLHLVQHAVLKAPARAVETGLTMLPIVAAAEAIRVASDYRVQPTVKWVNDLLVDQRKVAGVLTASQLQGDVVERVTFGIGINVKEAPLLPVAPHAVQPGSLAAWSISLPRLFDVLVETIDKYVEVLRREGSMPLYEAYRAQADFMEREVWLWPEQSAMGDVEQPLLRGRVLDMLPDLSLVIEGQLEPIRKGRMTYVTD